MGVDPCRRCGSDVRLVQVESQRRVGAKAGRLREKRRCTNPACRTNTHSGRLTTKP